MRRYWQDFRGWIDGWIVLILLLGAVLRLVLVGTYPAGLTWDEAAITYDAWGISLDGKDQWGQYLPLSFRSFGDYKAPVLVYLLAIVFKFWPMSDMAIRYLVGAFGSLLILVTYWMGGNLFNRKVGLMAAFMIALSPWHIHLSRVGFEATLATTFFAIGATTFIKALKRNAFPWLSVIIYGLAFYSYHSTKITVLLVLILSGLMFKFKNWVLWAGMLLIITLPFFLDLQSSASRATQTLIFFNQNQPISRVVENIVRNFDFNFWVMGIEKNMRHMVPGYGIITWVELLLLIFAVGLGIKKRNKKIGWLFGIVAIGLIPSILSTDSPHALRVMTVLPYIQVICAWALLQYKWMIKPIAMGIVAISAGFLGYYLNGYVVSSAKDFQFGYKQAMLTVRRAGRTSERIVISDSHGQPYIYYLLYMRIKPKDFISGGTANVRFGQITGYTEPDTLYVDTQMLSGVDSVKILDKINYPKSGEVAFVILKTSNAPPNQVQ